MTSKEAAEIVYGKQNEKDRRILSIENTPRLDIITEVVKSKATINLYQSCKDTIFCCSSPLIRVCFELGIPLTLEESELTGELRVRTKAPALVDRENKLIIWIDEKGADRVSSYADSMFLKDFGGVL